MPARMIMENDMRAELSDVNWGNAFIGGWGAPRNELQPPAFNNMDPLYLRQPMFGD